MKKLLLILLTAMILLTACGDKDPAPPEDSVTPPPAEETGPRILLIGVIVNGEVVNIRQKPSTDGRVIDAARRGEMFEILDETDGWCQVRYRGDIAYISASFLYQQEWEDEAKILLGTINDAGYNAAVRSSASTDAAIMLRAMKGERFIVTAADYSEGWHQIHYNGNAAYIGSECLGLKETTINQALFP